MISEAFNIIFSLDVFGGLFFGIGLIAIISEIGNKDAYSVNDEVK